MATIVKIKEKLYIGLKFDGGVISNYTIVPNTKKYIISVTLNDHKVDCPALIHPDFEKISYQKAVSDIPRGLLSYIFSPEKTCYYEAISKDPALATATVSGHEAKWAYDHH